MGDTQKEAAKVVGAPSRREAGTVGQAASSAAGTNAAPASATSRPAAGNGNAAAASASRQPATTRSGAAAASQEAPMTPLSEQWPYLRFLGFGAWWAWIWLCYNSTGLMRLYPSGDQAPRVLLMYLVSTVAIGVSTFALALLWRRSTKLIDSRAFVIGGGALASLFTVIIGYSAVMGGSWFFAVAAALTGVGTSVICLRAGRIYGSISLGESLTAGGISLLLAAFLYFTGIGIPEDFRIFFIAALPLIAALLLTMKVPDPFDAQLPAGFAIAGETSASASGEGGAPATASPAARRMYRKLVAASALVAFTAGVGKGISSMAGDVFAFAQNGSVTVLAVGVLGVAAVVVVNRGDAVRGARQVYSMLIVLGIAMMLATCFGFPISYLSIGKECLWMVFSCFMAYLAFRYDLSAVRVFGFGQGAYFFASAIGWLIGACVQPHYGEGMVRMAVGMALAFIVVVVLVYVFPENDLKKIMARSVDDDAATASARETVRAAQQAFSGQACANCPAHDGALAGECAAVNADGEGIGTASSMRSSTPAESVSSAASAGGKVPGSLSVPMSPSVTAPAAVPSQSGGNPADPRYGLSQRELEVLYLFAQGRSASWIAENLVISKNTVRTHLRAIYSKLDIHSRQDLLDFLAGNLQN
jgi:DNA-binding CsgD family transcriptional regulator/uncharacterized membrane protein